MVIYECAPEVFFISAMFSGWSEHERDEKLIGRIEKNLKKFKVSRSVRAFMVLYSYRTFDVN